ncbi:Dynamin family protein [Methanoregula boonei 6A8]|uniref:Dynamin family protein n=1 Tax=Methanoregula boonei (strain DSM 21154 / JCM 14090 / 6A8) TaxID=456442 RepID=A7I6U0_METB6|nr:dynamin family protein [Methanoregula boonei]ABS55451.1 Dynamin family protein [Methanoregula boonei 6A8]
MTPGAAPSNDYLAKHLRVTCQYIDRLLGEIEGVLYESSSRTAFPEYVMDITPVQQKMIEDYIARIRTRLVQVMEGQGMISNPPGIPVSRAVHSRLFTIDVAAEELKPQYMMGFGDIPDTTATELNGIAGELQALVSRLGQYLERGSGQDFQDRLQRLEAAGNDLALLSRIEMVVAKRGLVEFRGTIDSILDRAEDRSFEIAVFGRVSSGKSSLLNAIIGTDVLPVGVTPVTAVPTRIIHGKDPSLTVSFADAPARTFETRQLAEFATEQHNPNNIKHVTRVTVTIPVSRLFEGVSFVDTPGLGSLATGGAAETRAYLPRCDLGVVLIDAGSTLTEEDVRTIRTLQEAAIPAHILLSKADLLDRPDCEKTLGYIRQHIASETGLDLPVYPVSVYPSHQKLLDRWFEKEIVPVMNHAQDLRAASLQRKIGALRESLAYSLKNQIRRSRHAPAGNAESTRDVEIRLRRATGLIVETGKACREKAEAMNGKVFGTWIAGAAVATSEGHEGADGKISDKDAVRTAVLQTVQAGVNDIQSRIETLATSLQDELVKSALDLSIADVPGDKEFLSLIRDMPSFDPETIKVTVPPYALTAMLGTHLGEKLVSGKLHRLFDESFGLVIAGYFRLLKEWSSQVTYQMGRKFETYAERYRAQAVQSPGGRELTADEVNAIEKDLRDLGENA